MLIMVNLSVHLNQSINQCLHIIKKSNFLNIFDSFDLSAWQIFLIQCIQAEDYIRVLQSMPAYPL